MRQIRCAALVVLSFALVACGGGLDAPGDNPTGDTGAAGETLTTATTSSPVILNEILANEPGSSTSGEFIELVNTGSSAVDLSGWTLSDSSSVRHTFAGGTQLAAGGPWSSSAPRRGFPRG